MQILNNFIQQINKPDFTQMLKTSQNKFGSDLNCVRIGIVQEFYAENLTALVQIASKKVLQYNQDGTQTVREYAPIIAKVCYCNPFITAPLAKGDEVVLLFNDRELETWFINGQSNLQGHMRMHDLTDCIAIAGIRSLPKMIEILTTGLNLFYGQSNIAIENAKITANSTNIDLNATVSANHIDVDDGASGNIVDTDGKTLAKVVNGIITEIY